MGVYIIESFESITDFLAADTMQWQDGPSLPGDMRSFDPCAVTISDTSFLTICGNDIREFDASVSGPTSNEGWRKAKPNGGRHSIHGGAAPQVAPSLAKR